ncbi:MAG: cobalamin-independent methionine synthase II family protein [Chloroflexi bacterium]|nr:cobalamin-independent methionine synthase II family protein [Chloroflexota bacterium]
MAQIQTTHTGSLPRPPELLPLLYGHDPRLGEHVQAAVRDAVGKQRKAGISIVNDGEMGKVAYSTYIVERLTGFTPTGQPRRMMPPDIAAFPNLAAERMKDQASRPAAAVPAFECTGPISYTGRPLLDRDIANLREATKDLAPGQVFMSAASPGVVRTFQENHFYRDDEEYIQAVGSAMREEYEAIVAAGFTLQLDCPDLSLLGITDKGASAEFLRVRVDAINAATANIPPERMRMHICWGNYEGPHHLDTPIRELLPALYQARPAALSFEGANPRHEHEWQVFRELPLPDGKTIIPGIIDSTTNYIEHPELVAERIRRYVDVVGAERVVAGTDCGFGTFAGAGAVHPAIVYAKLSSLAEGARLASNGG